MVHPYNAFIKYGPPKRVIEVERSINGFTEGCVLEIYEVVAAGIPMFAMIQRQGNSPVTTDDLQRYALLTPNFACLKEMVEIWRHSWYTGNEGVIQEIGVTWHEFYNAIDDNREHGKDYRVRFTTDDLDEEVGFLYSVDGYRNGIIRTAKDAAFYDSRSHAELSMYGCAVQIQVDTFRDTCNYLIDLHKAKNLIGHLEKRVGKMWVSLPEKQMILPFKYDTAEFYSYAML